MKLRTIITGLCLFAVTAAHAQSSMMRMGSNTPGSYAENNDTTSRGNNTWGRREAKKKIPTPIGVSQWSVDELTGDSLAAENMDTVVHNFQFWNMTEGKNGEYNILGNLGSPRLSRIYMHRKERDNLFFIHAYDFFLNGQDGFRFSNTKSPLTNLAYHKMGNKTNGSERFRAYFASNINKQSGIGFKVDYLYARGMFMNQQNSMFDGTFFGYHMGERYQVHAYVDANHNKMGENGGLEKDEYITDPQSLPQRYGSRDIPTNLAQTWNRNDGETYFLTHRYRMGFYREIAVPDSLKPKMPKDYELLAELSDSLQQVLRNDSIRRALAVDSLRTRWQQAQIPPTEFVPVSSINHSFRARTLRHRYYSYDANAMNYYPTLYYGTPNNVSDRATVLEIDNTITLSMVEGFNKWAAMGINLFATHHLESFQLPQIVGDTIQMERKNRQKLYLGGRLTRHQGKLIHYDATARFVAAGEDMGEFEVDGTLDLNFPLGRKDTVQFEAHGFVKNLQPTYFLRHFHSQYAWWDNDFDKEFSTRIEGTLTNRRTKTSLTVGVENVKNHAYLAMRDLHEVTSRQYSGNIQVFSVGLKQNFHIGRPLHWDNEIWYQTSSKQDILPLPKLNIYTNLYLKFRIAKTLNVQLGGDLRWFSGYYAPDYSPMANQFAVQDTEAERIKIGNYPIINVYANLHLKHCRLYVSGRHVNAGTGNRFWAPHYAMDPLAIHFGLSWNFFN